MSGDVGAEVAEHLSRRRPHHHRGQVENTHTAQRTGRRVFLIGQTVFDGSAILPCLMLAVPEGDFVQKQCPSYFRYYDDSYDSTNFCSTVKRQSSDRLR